MARNFLEYSNQGREKVEKRIHYDLTASELHFLLDDVCNLNDMFDAVTLAYYSGIESGWRMRGRKNMDEKEVKGVVFEAQGKIGIANSLFNILLDELDLDGKNCRQEALYNFTSCHDVYCDICMAVLDYIRAADNLLDTIN